VSDFLSQLLERATGQAPVLEYRRASLFEPLTKMMMPFDDLQPDPAIVETETEVISSKDKKSSQRREIEFRERSKPVTERVSAETEGTIAQEERTPDNKRPTKPKLEQTEEQLSTIVDRSKHSTTEAESSPRETQEDPVKEVTNVPARVVETRLERKVVIVADHENRDAPVNEKTRQPEVPQSAVQLIKPTVRHVQTESTVEPKRHAKANEETDFITSPAKISSIKPAELPHAIPGSFIKPPRRSSDTQAHLPAPAPAPTVQVTIGRVEVRATPAPLVKQSPSRVAPKLTLEDYLRGRSGERA